MNKKTCIPQQVANRDLATDSNRNTDQNGTQCSHTASPPTQPVPHLCQESAPTNPKSKIKNQKSQRPASSNTTAAQGSSTSCPPTLNSNNHQLSTHGIYRLRRGLGFWQLTFAGREAVIKHEQGLAYVVYLLTHPNEQLHALDLATRVGGRALAGNGITEITNPATGGVSQLSREARIQERALGLEEAETMRSVLQLQEKLEALLEHESTTEPEKEELQRQLIDLYAYEKKRGPRVRDSAAKASDAVGRAIKRLHKHFEQGGAAGRSSR